MKRSVILALFGVCGVAACNMCATSGRPREASRGDEELLPLQGLVRFDGTRVVDYAAERNMMSIVNWDHETPLNIQRKQWICDPDFFSEGRDEISISVEHVAEWWILELHTLPQHSLTAYLVFQLEGSGVGHVFAGLKGDVDAGPTPLNLHSHIDGFAGFRMDADGAPIGVYFQIIGSHGRDRTWQRAVCGEIDLRTPEHVARNRHSRVGLAP